jgi:S-adenosylmethionine-diacylglycerol 3-amino-3-carboxypropyl transferase
MSIVDYSQCWEDADLLQEALCVGESDAVLSVASAGDNTLALLPFRPRRMVFVDKNPAQIHLCELKLKAPAVLGYRDYLELLGVSKATGPARTAHLDKVMPFLSAGGRAWWADHRFLVESGLVDCGRFERYLGRFRRYLLPLVHDRSTISALLDCAELAAQQAFYRDRWATWRWKLFLRLAASRTLLRFFARQPGQDRGDARDRDTDYSARLEDLFRRQPLKGNPYMRSCFAGDYGPDLPAYLRPETFAYLARDLCRTDVSLATETLHDHLQSTPDATYSKFNLSDVFEAFSEEESGALWQQIVRTATDGARIVYWCNQVERHPGAALAPHVVPDLPAQGVLAARDRLFFYRSFNVRVVRK